MGGWIDVPIIQQMGERSLSLRRLVIAVSSRATRRLLCGGWVGGWVDGEEEKGALNELLDS